MCVCQYPQTDSSDTSPALLRGQKMWRQGRDANAKYFKSTPPHEFLPMEFLNHHHSDHVKYVIISPLIDEENDLKMDDIISQVCKAQIFLHNSKIHLSSTRMSYFSKLKQAT